MIKQHPSLSHFFIAVLLLAGLASAALAQESGKHAGATGTAGPKLQDFELIWQRNIFNPNRSPAHSDEMTTATNTVTTATSPPAQTIDLLGTWLSERQVVAILQSSQTEYDGIKQQGSRVGEWTIAGIHTDHVVLDRDGRSLLWPVGKRLERSGEEPWQLAESVLTVDSASTATQNLSSTDNSPNQDIKQRMRARRRSEKR